MKHQKIRANYDRETITVYQAYNKNIAIPAIKNNHFEKPFSFTRMTWRKPSYLWMMERSGWGRKSNQEYILAIKIKREYWEKALRLSVLTNPDKDVYKNSLEWEEKFKNSKVRIQWDPERTLIGEKQDARSIQVGISRDLMEEYNNEWIVEIIDFTPLSKKINSLRKLGKYKEAKRLLPVERVYELNESLAKVVGIR